MSTSFAEDYVLPVSPKQNSIAASWRILKGRLISYWTTSLEEPLRAEAIVVLQTAGADAQLCAWAERYLCGMERGDFAAYLKRRTLAAAATRGG